MVPFTNHIFRRRPLAERLPTMDALVIQANIDGWAVSKILVNGGSSADIIFTSTLDAMKSIAKY